MYTWKAIKHRVLPRTLFGRSLMIILTPVLLLQAIIAFTFFDRHWDKMTEKLVTSLAGEVRLVVDSLDAAKTKAETQRIVEQAAVLELLVSLEDKGNVKQEPRAPLPDKLTSFNVDKILYDAMERKLRRPFVLSAHDSDRWFEVRVQLKDGRVARIASQNKRVISPTTYIFILWMIGSALVLFAIAVFFMRNQIRPIRRLALAAERLGKGQDVANFKLEGATEVRLASKAFLEMKDRLKRQIEQRTAMLAGVSHDLRTPLTRMKLQLAMAGDNPEIANLRQDVDEMEKMIEAYLTFAKGEGNETPEMTDMKTVLDRVVAGARRQGCDVQAMLADKMLMRVRPVAVERAVANIVSNACKYGRHVWVSAYPQTESLEISVDDDGPGIPEELREDVFRPFYRVEKSRNRKTGGIGLGLSIARDVVHSHGGEIFLENSNRGGLRAVIRLPL